MNTKTVEVTVYVLVDSDGEWAAAGDSNENPQDDIEILKFVRKWNIAEVLGFCRVHRVKVRLPVPELVETENFDLFVDYSPVQRLGDVLDGNHAE